MLVILVLAWWTLKSPMEKVPTGEVPTSEENVTPGAGEPVISIPDPSTPNPTAPAAPASGQLKILKNTTIRTFNEPNWHFVFSAPAEWDFGTVKDTDGDIEQIQFESEGGNIRVSREDPIAEPSLLIYKTEMKSIAGAQVSVHRYEKPNEKYAYYLYFTLESGNYQYYVSLKSVDSASAFADEFLSRIVAK